MTNENNHNANSLVTFHTRYVETTKADAILPFVLDALNTVGLGSACVVRNGVNDVGIQLTAPVDLALLLESTIKKLHAVAAPKFPNNVFFPPLLYVAGNTGTISAVIEQLRLLPPDMRITWIRVDDEKYAIAVAGPEVRANDFRTQCLPSLTAIVRSLEPAGFPIT